MEVCSVITQNEHDLLVERSKSLRPAREDYRINDYVTNLLLTVTDFMLHTKTVVAARQYYEQHHWNDIRTHEDLKRFLACYPDTPESNSAAAKALWGYNLWTRLALLRRLVEYFEHIGVTTQDQLKDWAYHSSFKRDFKGKVKGLGPAVYNWLVMRQGVETIKPDVHVHRFVATTLHRKLSDDEVVQVLIGIAHELGLKAYELDWRIWEYQRRGM
jgi:hypothetical protein